MPGVIERKIPWLIQPQYPVELSQEFTLPTAAWVFAQNLRDLAGGKTATLSGSDLGTGRELSVIHDTTADKTVLAPSSDLCATQAGTYIIRYRKRDATNRASGLFGLPSGDRQCGVHGPWSDGVVYWDFGGATAGSTRLTVSGQSFELATWAFTTGARGMEIWKNGVRIASNAANPTRVQVGVDLKLGEHVNNNSDFIDVSAFYAYRGVQLPQEELVLLGQNPWQIFQPIKRRIWVAGVEIQTVLAPAGSGPTLRMVNAHRPESINTSRPRQGNSSRPRNLH